MTRAALLFVALTACTGAKLSAVRTTVSQLSLIHISIEDLIDGRGVITAADLHRADG